jgi:hypothetical protein
MSVVTTLLLITLSVFVGFCVIRFITLPQEVVAPRTCDAIERTSSLSTSANGLQTLPAPLETITTLSVCDWRKLTVPNMTFHGNTARGWVLHMQALHVPWLRMPERLTEAGKRFRLLEIGVGSGHTIMNIQAAYPYSRLTGTNGPQYPFPQVRFVAMPKIMSR